MNFRAVIYVAIVPLALAACSATAGNNQTGAPQPAATCRNDLALAAGWPISPMTGEHAESLAVVNTGRSACLVKGVPGVELYTASGKLLQFRYARGGQYVGTAKPASVTLRPGQKAEIVLAKYRCDLGDGARAVTVHLNFPDGGFVSGTLPVTGPAGFSYCAGSASDPGHLVEIGPVTSSRARAR